MACTASTQEPGDTSNTALSPRSLSDLTAPFK